MEPDQSPSEIKIEVSPASANATEHPTTFLQNIIRATEKCDIGHFRVCMSMCMQALLWKTLVQYTTTSGSHFLEIDVHRDHDLPSTALILLWCLSLFTLITTFLIYTLKCWLHFDRVKQEFMHHVGVNYFFAPWISSLLLLQALPNSFSLNHNNHNNNNNYNSYSINCNYWWVFVVPIVALDVKIYGHWFTKGKRFLSRVANPASQIGVIANLAAARATSELGWKEGALFLFSLGMAHYLVLFVTLYQRLPGGDGFPISLRPVFFLFIATPSMASFAWSSIHGGFGTASKMLFFLSLFLFLSLVSRPRLFEKAMKKYNVAWWSYSFSLTLLALTAMEYAGEVKSTASHALMMILSTASILLFFVMLLFTTFINVNFNYLTSRTTAADVDHDNSSSIKT
ncbi:hypothetical protein V2J09_015766 [Rumex salicifolius]